MSTRLFGDGGRERGQGVVEFALVIPIFLLVVFGLLDAGRAVHTNSVLSQAAREGARLAATQAAWVGITGGACVESESQIDSSRPGGHVCPRTAGDLKANIVNATSRMVTAVGPIAGVYISCNAGTVADPVPTGAWTESSGGNGCVDGSGTSLGAAGDIVSVRVEHAYAPMTPIISSIIGTTTLGGSASMVIN